MRSSAAFILTHGRPNNVLTYQALRTGGYTGPIYLIVDNEDKMLEEYKKSMAQMYLYLTKKKLQNQ